MNQPRMIFLGVGVLALGAAGAGAAGDTSTFFTAYLYAYLFWLGLGLGSLGLLMLHHLVGGGWGFSIQRLLEAGAKTVPVMGLLFIPIVFGMHDLYHWTHEIPATDHILLHKVPYLNEPFFVGRTVFYFLLWSVMALLLTRWSNKQEQGEAPGIQSNRLKALSGPGLVFYVLSMTFAAFDWGMSLDPHWFSTIYGLIFVIGQGLSAIAFMIIALSFAKPTSPELDAFANVDRIHDLGKLLLAFTMLWAYMGLSQYVIIWMANLPEEIGWYILRSEHGWQHLTTIVVVGQFFIPFLLLLSRWPKRNIRQLRLIAGWIILMRFFDLFWLIKPDSHHPEMHVSWIDLAAPIGIGGLWLFLFLTFSSKSALVPSKDPRFVELNRVAH